MRILIIGGTLFIGWHIASALRRAGHSVCVFHRGSTPLEGLDGVSEIRGDKTDLPSYRDRFCQFGPDFVIDCIGYTEADGARLIETFAGGVQIAGSVRSPRLSATRMGVPTKNGGWAKGDLVIREP